MLRRAGFTRYPRSLRAKRRSPAEALDYFLARLRSGMSAHSADAGDVAAAKAPFKSSR